MMVIPIFDWWLIAILFVVPLGAVIFRLVVSFGSKRERNAWIRRLAILVLVLVMALRPSMPGASRAQGNNLLDVYFIVDTTISIKAEDYNGTKQRIEGIRQDVKDIAAKLAGARFSLISFNNSTVQELPLTSDASAIGAMVDTIQTASTWSANGSSIDAPVDKTKSELERIRKDNPQRGRVVFYMGDGEQTARSTPKSFDVLRGLISGGAVLGYGSSAGGRMLEDPIYGSEQQKYMRVYDDSGKQIEAVSRMDERNLNAIASQMGVKYTHRTQPGDVDALVEGIDISRIIAGSSEIDAYEDYYWVLAPGFIALVAWDSWRLYATSKQLRILRKKEQA